MTLARVINHQVQEQGGEVAPLPEVPGGLEAWARKAQLAFDVAKALAFTPFVPDSLTVYRVEDNKRVVDREASVGNVLGVLLAGDELGLQPMAALRSIDIITGTPALRAITQRALVQAAGHEIVVEESTSTRCVVKGRRKGTTEWQRSMWDLDRAKGLNLLGKENWRKQPTSMLIARASSECCRLVASDALLGMPYSAEELADGIDSVETSEPVEKAKKGKTAQRRTAQAKTADSRAQEGGDVLPPEPSFDEPPAAPNGSSNGAADAPAPGATSETQPGTPSSQERASDAAAPPPELATTAQLKKLHIVLGENGIADRTKGLSFISNFIERDVTSSKQLTKAECSQLIDALSNSAAAPAGPAEPGFDEIPLPTEPPEE